MYVLQIDKVYELRLPLTYKNQRLYKRTYAASATAEVTFATKLRKSLKPVENLRQSSGRVANALVRKH